MVKDMFGNTFEIGDEVWFEIQRETRKGYKVKEIDDHMVCVYNSDPNRGDSWRVYCKTALNATKILKALKYTYPEDFI